jgi:hypothetical protein
MPHSAWSLVLAAVFFALYAFLSPSASGDKDGSEFTLVLALCGAAHPSGYPLYVMAGHLFVSVLHAWGASWPLAANLWSALGGAVSIFFLHRLTLFLVPASAPLTVTQRWAASLIPILLFGLNPLWTYETTLAEVYSWHLAWVCATCFCAAWILRSVHTDESPVGEWAWMQRAGVWGTICGLGAIHHLTSVLVAAPLSVALCIALANKRQLTWRRVASAAVAFTVCLGVYAFVAWRAFVPALWQWPALAPTWMGVKEHIFAVRYAGFLGTFRPSEVQADLLRSYLYPWVVPATGLLIAAAFLPATPWQRTTLRALAATAVIGLGYAFNYGVPDPSSYFLAPLAIACAGLVPCGMGLIAWKRQLRSVSVAVGILLMLIACGAGVRWVQVAEGRKVTLEKFDAEMEAMWQTVSYDSAFVVWGSDMHTRLVEYQLLRGEKPGIRVIDPGLLAQSYPRSRFIAEYGIDPVPGAGPGAGVLTAVGIDEVERFTAEMAHHLNQRSPLPVIVFDPIRKSVRLLRKESPGEGKNR